MQRINRDSVLAITLLVACGVLLWASFDIREPNYGVLMPSTWPRLVIAVLALLSFIYLFQSLGADPNVDLDTPAISAVGWVGFFAYWRNPIICFAMYFAFLASLPVLGMLIGGISFVFLLMCLLGGWAPRQLIMHAVLAILTIGAMWSLFTFGLGVMLPVGMIYNPFAA